MAAIGKIRSWGPVLIIIIGLALFGFIAGDMFRSCESTGRMNSSKMGEVLGENIHYEDYQKYLAEFDECSKLENPNANEDQLRNAAWNSFMQNKIIENEAKELGLNVTDEEIVNVLKEGTNQMLMQVANITGFVNQQTGRFDYNQYLKFHNEKSANLAANPQLAEMYDKVDKYMNFKIKQLREGLLSQKYQALLASCVLSNPVEAKFFFDGEKQESDIQLAYIDYKSINDKDKAINITEADLKAKYDEIKERLGIKIPEEVRSVKYIMVRKEASPADRNALTKALETCAEQLKNGEDPAKVVREGNSSVNYLGLPVTKKAFTADIANRLDSMAVGSVLGPVESQADNTLNVIKLLAKYNLPDSVQFRAISIMDEDKAKCTAKADSVFKAVSAGGDFEAIAKNYSQTGEKQWITTASYEKASNMTKDNEIVFKSLNEMAANEVKNIPLTNGNVILQVVDRREMVTKYDVAVVKREITYSDETSHKVDNDLKQFVSGHQTLETMEKDAAKAGYQVLEAKQVVASQGIIPGIANSQDALKWAFTAEKNDMSEVMTCGENNECKIVLVLTGIYEKGYIPLDNEDVRNMVQQEVLIDKKAEIITAKLKDVKSIEQAKAKGAKVVEEGVKQITFAAPVYITAIQAQEPALSGAVAATAKGQFSAKPVKGNSGVYVFKVDDRRTTEGKFDAKEYAAKAANNYMQAMMSSAFQDLFINAEVKDNRYLFR